MALFNTHYPYMGGAAKTFEPIVYSQMMFYNYVRGSYNNAGLKLNTKYRIVSGLATFPRANYTTTATISPENITLTSANPNQDLIHSTQTYNSIPNHTIKTTGSQPTYSSAFIAAYPYKNGIPDYVIYGGSCYHDSDGNYTFVGQCNNTQLTTTNNKIISPGKYYISGYKCSGTSTANHVYIDNVDFGTNSQSGISVLYDEYTITTGNIKIGTYGSSPINSQSYVLLLLWKK